MLLVDTAALEATTGAEEGDDADDDVAAAAELAAAELAAALDAAALDAAGLWLELGEDEPPANDPPFRHTSVKYPVAEST